jgi:hypothetical protein
MNLIHQGKGVYRLPCLEHPAQTWVSYGALAALHYDVDAGSPYWDEPPWQKFTFRPLVIELGEEDEP